MSARPTGTAAAPEAAQEEVGRVTITEDAGASRQQQLDALAIANGVRLEQATYKRALRAEGYKRALATVRAEVDAPRTTLRRVELSRFLTWIPSVGKATVLRLIVRSGVSPTRRLGDLTPRERRAVADVLEGAM